ncbi:MAG: triose-phosphate isomerase [Hyphomonadaceae bacterium]|nr:triose-phosphate isomerase [Hyphomonadaceae bacterium]
MSRRPLIAGNWKMYGRLADLGELDALCADIGEAATAVDVAICPPATLIVPASARAVGGAVRIGAQDCSPGGDGAQTGDLNAAMLADAGAAYCIVGHSERRRDHGETSALVARKAASAAAAGLVPIICVGETLEERRQGRTIAVVGEQLAESVPETADARTVIAYEPVWAIGTGLTPTVGEIGAVHAALRKALLDRFGAVGAAVRLLYGGSVKPANAAEIFAVDDVDGALVGGASLKAADFAAIIRAHPAASAP